MSETVENVACTLCGCVCDDLRLVIEGSRIIEAERACDLAAPWYLQQHLREPPANQIEGETVPHSAALSRAAAILNASRAPLIFGLSRSSTEGQRAAVELADQLGATIDTTASLCHAPSIMAFQHTGESTSSLGEIRNRSDLVVFWGSDPAVSHPRHFERYSVDPMGEFVPEGRRDRTVVVVDRAPSASSAQADLFLQVAPEQDFEALWSLRRLISGDLPNADVPTGLPLEALRDLAERMKSCRSGVVFFGLGLSRSGLGHLNVAALLLLVRDLHRYTRFYARRLRLHGDVTGADSVLCWQTGYPFSVNLARGYPRFNPGEYSAQDLLAAGEVDACVVVGSETLTQLSPAAQRHLQRIPTIVLDYPPVDPPFTPTVRFTTAIYGIHRPGTAYRMDEVPIPLKSFLPADYPSDDEVLSALTHRLVRSGE